MKNPNRSHVCRNNPIQCRRPQSFSFIAKYCFHLNIIFSGFSAAFVVIDDADNFDYTPFESAAPLRNNYERKPPRQKAL